VTQVYKKVTQNRKKCRNSDATMTQQKSHK